MKVDLTVIPLLGLTPNQLYLLACKQKGIQPASIVDQIDYQPLLDKQLLTSDGITPVGEALLARAVYKTKTSSGRLRLLPDDEQFVEQYRLLWPSMKLPNNTYGRSSVRELKPRFEVFFSKFPELKDWPLILEATAAYLDEAEQRQFEYTQNSETFIYKTDQYKVIRSTLAKYCQLIREEGVKERLMAAPSLITIPGL